MRTLGQNIEITKLELDQIRKLPDFDLTMFLSEIHDHGWPKSRRTLQMIVEYLSKSSQPKEA